MENMPIVDENVAPKKNVLFEVTTVSKSLAAILFVILPFVGFWIGTKYSKEINSEVQIVTIPSSVNEVPKPQNVVTTVDNTEVIKGLAIPEDSFWVSARTDILKGYLSKKVLGKDEVLGDLSEGETVTCDTFTIIEGDLSIFKYLNGDKYESVGQDMLPYEIYIGDGDIKNLPQMTQDILRKSSPTTPVLTAITEYVNSAGKGLDTCESEVELFIAI